MILWTSLSVGKSGRDLVDDKPERLLHTRHATNRDKYPAIYSIISILLTMPVSSATNQRSYSTIRCVKFYLRSNMGDERLFNLSLMDIHRHVQVDLDINIDDFVSRRKQCLDFSSTYSSGGICELSGGFAP